MHGRSKVIVKECYTATGEKGFAALGASFCDIRLGATCASSSKGVLNGFTLYDDCLVCRRDPRAG